MHASVYSFPNGGAMYYHKQWFKATHTYYLTILEVRSLEIFWHVRVLCGNSR